LADFAVTKVDIGWNYWWMPNRQDENANEAVFFDTDSGNYRYNSQVRKI